MLDRYSHCPKCGVEIKKQTVDQMVDEIMSLPDGPRFSTCPAVRGRKEPMPSSLNQLRKVWLC